MKSKILALFLATLSVAPAVVAGGDSVLPVDRFKPYIDKFNADDRESFSQAYPNSKAWEFLSANITLFECPDKELELTYYFRWWTFRKQLQQTPDGWVINEFLPAVPWGGKYNTINCASGHHVREARWLKDRKYVEDYIRFWLQKNARGVAGYSTWHADSVWNYCATIGDFTFAKELLPDLVKYYQAWEHERQDINGMFWQNDGADGMEGAIGGRGFRPTINSYMYGNAMAIARIADLSEKKDLAEQYRAKAAAIKKLVQDRLWHPDQQFFEVRKGPYTMGLFGWRVNSDVELTKKAKPAMSGKGDLAGLNGGANPPNSWDWKYPHVSFGVGTEEWVQYDFPAPVKIDSTQLLLMCGGGYEPPESFRLLYREGGAWKEVSNVSGKIEIFHRWNSLKFDPVTTDGLKLELRLAGFDRNAAPLRDVREQLGYTPWYFDLPDPQYSVAWKQITDTNGFAAPYGLTTAERRHPEFQISYVRHECLWNGPVWPFATAQTLTALANLLNDYRQDVVDRGTYFDALSIYARSHRMTLADGKIVPWIDEDQNPFTGDWIARTCILDMEKNKPVTFKKKGGTSDRGKDYNHSTFCDLVINGLVGLRPQADDKVVVNPLVPEGKWDYFCLDRVPYHGRMLTIFWDKTGTRYGKGTGLFVLQDGKEIARSERLSRVAVRLLQ